MRRARGLGPPHAPARRRWATCTGEKHAAAVAIPDGHQAIANWDAALADQARRTPDDAASRALFAEAGAKFAAAVAIKPDGHQALANWGAALIEQARRTRDDAAARALFAEAEDVLIRAGRIVTGHSYNLACVMALPGDWKRLARSLLNPGATKRCRPPSISPPIATSTPSAIYLGLLRFWLSQAARSEAEKRVRPL